MDLSVIDKNIIWHPFTQHQIVDPPIAIKYAKGNYLYDYDGNKYLDLISSWWVNLHGHAHPKIAEAIYHQALKLEHVIFAGFTHAPAVELCKLVIKELPNNLKVGFYSDNGSTSVEVAIKMAYQYWFNLKQYKRKLFINFTGGYHGDTFGAMSVGNASGFHEPFKKLFFQVLSIPFPATFEGDQEVELKEEKALIKLKEYLLEYKNQIVAIVLEPLVQGAAGMQICRHEFIAKLIALIKFENILVIVDEVMTGFGRTGTYFALNQLNQEVDFVCLSKGITGGFLPLALTVTTQNVYSAFLDQDMNKAFLHGHSYTANPLACAAGIASFKLLKNVLQKNQIIPEIYATHKEGIKILQEFANNVCKFRSLGTIAAFEYNSNDINFNLKFKQACLNKGLLIRPLKNTIYLIPPYSITRTQLLNAYLTIAKLINDLKV